MTICFTAPTAYRAMLRSGRAPALRRTLRRAVSAGEHLPEATWHAFLEATGVRLIDGIGSTEMLHIFVSAADDDIRPGATGKPVPGYQAAVLDDKGHPVPPGTPGRLAVKGPTGCRYLADSRQTTYVQDGWNFTGDTFVQDADGYLIYQARSDDMIVSSGYNIAGPEVEEALLQHDAVAECCVVGLPDPRARPAGHRLRRAARGRLRRAGTGRRTAGLRQAADRAVQVPAGRRVRDRAAPQLTGKVQRYVLRQQAPGQQAPGQQAPAAGHGRLRRAAGCASQSSAAARAGCTSPPCARQLDPDHEITVWERNAADDTFGFGVVFSDETLGGIEHADARHLRGDGARVRPLGRHRRALPRARCTPAAGTASPR